MTEIQLKTVVPLAKGKAAYTFENGVKLELYRSEIAKLPRTEAALLYEENYIPERLYQKLLYEIVGMRAKKRAVYLLEQMDRTKKQLTEKLEKNGYPAACVEDAIAYVEQYHYLDDGRYARNYVRFKQGQKSRRRLKVDLTVRGIGREVIEEALDAEYCADETEQIRQLLEKRHYDYQGKDSREKQRAYQFLMRRGFQSSDVMKVLRAAER